MRHLASGLRRQVPVPVQGASISTRSAEALMSANGSASPFGARISALWTPALALHHGRQRQRLAARPRTEIDHLLAGFCGGEHGCQLRALVLDFDGAFY